MEFRARQRFCCEGNFIAEDITLVGAFVANSLGGGGSAMRMNRVNLVSVPGATDFSWSTAFGTSGGGGFGLNSSVLTTEAVLVDFATTEAPVPGQPPYNPSAVNLTSAKLKYKYRGTVYTRDQLIRSRDPLPSPRSGDCASTTSWRAYIECEEQTAISRLQEQLTKANETWLNTQFDMGRFELDLNKFLSIEDRVRTTSWSSRNGSN